MTADLSELFEQYYDSLVRMLYRRTGDRDRAEDLAQETFARAVAAPPNNPRPWLFAVALNLVREDGRRNVRQGGAVGGGRGGGGGGWSCPEPIQARRTGRTRTSNGTSGAPAFAPPSPH